MTLHIAIKAVTDDGNETCTAGRLDDCAFMGASAVEFGCVFVEERFVEDVLFGGIFVHLVDPDRKISTTLTLNFLEWICRVCLVALQWRCAVTMR